jgi:hypothetical protein
MEIANNPNLKVGVIYKLAEPALAMHIIKNIFIFTPLFKKQLMTSSSYSNLRVENRLYHHCCFYALPYTGD